MSETSKPFLLEIPDDLESYEWEVEKKGWFGNVGFLFEGNYYKLDFYDSHRLSQEILDELKEKPCFHDLNLIIVKTVNSKNMYGAIEYLIQENRINQLIPENKES